jgi:hypothetical protein
MSTVKRQAIKGQVLLLAIFSLVVGGTITYILAQPILIQMATMRSVLQSFQAIAAAETGLELEFLNQFKNINLLGSDINYPTSSRKESNGGKCQDDQPISGVSIKKDDRYSSGCVYGNLPSDVKFDIRVIANPKPGVLMQIETIGKTGENSRSLIFEQK